MIIVVPGVTTQSVRAPQPVSLIDVAPTIAALVGLNPPPGWQGHSMLDGTARTVRSFADHGATLLALRTGDKKVLVDEESNSVRVFDLSRDPAEQHDVAARFPELARDGRTDLEGWVARQRRQVRR